MISTKAELKEYIKYEKGKYGIQNEYIKYFCGNENAVIWNWQKRLRITEYHVNCGHTVRSVISKIILNHKRNKTGINIPLNVCEKGLRIMHLGSILVNGKAKIGKDCFIHISTAIAAGGTTHEAPIIGNNVVIGVGAIIVGKVNIADGIAIGANAFVNRTFEEENIAIAGVPARKISNNGKNKWERKIVNEE